MKVLINIITNIQIAEIRQTYPTFNGSFTITSGGVTETFIPGQWMHVPDAFVVPDNRKPFVKNARWVLRALVRQYLREQNLHQFAQGIIDAANQYGWAADTKTIPQAIIDMAPEEEIAE